MCTVVVRWSHGEPVRILALRDELRSRDFDEPGEWWPELPGVVGGRDRTAGGTWCAVSVGTGVTALVLNRPERRVAEPGAVSRGVLPLLALQHGAEWTTHVEVAPMASFLLVLATPERLTTWTFDASDLQEAVFDPGTWMFTSGYAEDEKIRRYLPSFRNRTFPDGWRTIVEGMTPADDPGALIVRHAVDGEMFATVFGQLIEARPGHLTLQYSRRPETAEPWQTAEYG